jgi:outer membrane protein TolC
MKPASRVGLRLLILLWLGAPCLPAPLFGEPVPLRRVVELALTHSSTAAGAEADTQRAYASYLESRNQYIPQVTFGSGLGTSFGYPLSLEGSAPSIFNATAQSALINPALREFIRSAKTDWLASVAQSKDQRNQVVQDTVLSYAELAKWQNLMGHLQEEMGDAVKLQQVVQQRVSAGVDSPLLQTRARLSTARIHYRTTEAQGAIDILRHRLSQLTGLPAESIDAVSDSIPALPEVEQSDNLSSKAVQSNPGIQASDLHATAESFRAQAERKSLWPSIDFAAQYALLDTTLNNYQRYFVAGSFQRHNATVGVAIRFPFLNASQHEHADAADAAAIRAHKDAQTTREKVSEETLRLQRSVEQLSAAQEVTQLEFEVAQSSLQALQVRYDAGTAALSDVEDARDQANQRYDAAQDANFELEKARIMLLRATNGLGDWAVSGK